MKRYLLLLLLMVTTLGSAVVMQHVARAVTSAPMTDAHIARIRSNCVEAQSSLAQIHASDALLRVNRGQLYESISTKLMAPLNSRIALNKLDGSTLVSTAADYEKALDTFRSDYQQYEEALSRALNMKCEDQPVAFYDGVSDAHDKRMQVHANVISLQALIAKYKTVFEEFSARQAKGN